MSIFDTLEQTVLRLFKKQDKAPYLTSDKAEFVLKIQKEQLEKLIQVFSSFNSSNMVSLNKKYMKTPVDPKNKNNVVMVIPTIQKKLVGKVGNLERNVPFSGIHHVAKILLKVNGELLKNIDSFIPNEGMNISNTKISSIMLLGMLQEADMFCKYTCYLWTHFTDTITKNNPYPIGYQAKWLNMCLDRYIDILNDVGNKDMGYSFVRDTDAIKRKNADLILYNNNQTFLSFLDKSAYSGSDQRRIREGIIGFNIVGYIVEMWNLWKHDKYLQNKAFKESLENQVAALRYDLMDVSQDSPEYQTLLKRIEMYNDEIVKYDKKLKEYEEE